MIELKKEISVVLVAPNGVDTQNGLKSGLLYDGGEGGEGAEITENKMLLLMRTSLKQ